MNKFLSFSSLKFLNKVCNKINNIIGSSRKVRFFSSSFDLDRKLIINSMANQNDGTNPSRFIKRRMDMQDEDIIINEMLNKKRKPFSVPTASTPTIGHQQETSSIQH